MLKQFSIQEIIIFWKIIFVAISFPFVRAHMHASKRERCLQAVWLTGHRNAGHRKIFLFLRLLKIVLFNCEVYVMSNMKEDAHAFWEYKDQQNAAILPLQCDLPYTLRNTNYKTYEIQSIHKNVIEKRLVFLTLRHTFRIST